MAKVSRVQSLVVHPFRSVHTSARCQEDASVSIDHLACPSPEVTVLSAKSPDFKPLPATLKRKRNQSPSPDPQLLLTAFSEENRTLKDEVHTLTIKLASKDQKVCSLQKNNKELAQRITTLEHEKMLLGEKNKKLKGQLLSQQIISDTLLEQQNQNLRGISEYGLQISRAQITIIAEKEKLAKEKEVINQGIKELEKSLDILLQSLPGEARAKYLQSVLPAQIP